MWWAELEALPARIAEAAKREPALDPTAHVDPDAVLDTSTGQILVGARTRICRGATISGPARIGADCLIGNQAMMRGPMWVEDGVRIGFSTELKNAIVETGVAIGPMCFVADSRIEAEAYLGALVRTSNHRLDRETVQVMVDGEIVDSGRDKLGCLIGARAALGIQVIVLPGRIIAPDSLFGPRITVERNLPPGRYRLEQRIETY